MKSKIKELKRICMIKNVNIEIAIEELTRISVRCSNTVQDDILDVIRGLQRGHDETIKR